LHTNKAVVVVTVVAVAVVVVVSVVVDVVVVQTSANSFNEKVALMPVAKARPNSEVDKKTCMAL
jgi:hypothetical protein